MRGNSEFRIQNSEVRTTLRRPPTSDLRPLPRRGFTLTELLIVMMILGIMTGLALSGLAGAIDLAREQRTRAIIAKLDQLIMERYEGYRTRSVPISAAGRQATYMDTRQAAQNRLAALRALMRMELPDRRTDIVNFQTSPPGLEIPGQNGNFNLLTQLGMRPCALQQSYFRMALRATGGNLTNWSVQNQGSECLYLIISTMHDGDKNALDYFLPGEIGDTDNDGMKEILDAWGTPIEFLRWAPAYRKDDPIPPAQFPAAAQTDQTALFVADPNGRPVYNAPDPFDPAKVDPRWSLPVTTPWGYALRPLIFSAGRDKKYDISTQLVDAGGNDFRYATTALPNGFPNSNDPYFVPTVSNQMPLGAQFDADGDGFLGFTDNITNHYQVTP